MTKRWLWMALWGALLLAPLGIGCESAFAPPESDGDQDPPETDGDHDTDVDLDPEADADADADAEMDAEIQTFNLRIRPDFKRQGELFEGEITLLNAEALKEALGLGPNDIPRWDIEWGYDDIEFLVVRFDPENLRWTDIQAVVPADARTGERIVTARLAFGGITIREYGKFYVLAPLESTAPLSK